MAEFGKLNFSVAFNPTSAFPLDARCFFDSLALAKAAAATAEDVGSSNTVYYFGMKLLVSQNGVETWYEIKRNENGIGILVEEGTGDNTGGGGSSGGDGGTSFTTDETLTLVNGVLKVNTTNEAKADSTLPITSAGVHTQIGNIEVLLKTI